ncbi:MAG TPA: thioredoxin family protein [bacterium]|nr:thioredoxin family protein [bacterium]HNS48301.1 thioredoxin family protein [bacterium]
MADSRKPSLTRFLAWQILAILLIVGIAAALILNKRRPSVSPAAVAPAPAASSASGTPGEIRREKSTADQKPAPGPAAPAAGSEPSAAAQEVGLPRLLELGADSCVPCKMMVPVLDGLRKDYAGRLKVEFIDVYEDSRAGVSHRVRVIPTQIFFDASGNELSRHEGFMSREDILAKWGKLGYDFLPAAGE